MTSELAQGALVALSRWIDAGNAHRDPEAIAWGRLAKIAEENGEVIEAFIGAITCTMEEVLEEQIEILHRTFKLALAGAAPAVEWADERMEKARAGEFRYTRQEKDT